MNKTLSLSAAALALFAVALPLQADAADRQISVNKKKFPTFTVDDSSQLESIGKTEDAAAADPQDVGLEDFTVDDSKRAEVEPAPQPKQQKTLRFKVKNRPQQALSAPVQEETDDTAELQSEEPSNVLNGQAALVKKPQFKSAPAESDDETAPSDDQTDEATTIDEDHSADIAADTPDDTTTEEATDPNELRYYVLKKKHYHQAKADYSYEEPTTYSYQKPTYTYEQPSYSGYQESNYTGSSCNHNYGY